MSERTPLGELIQSNRTANGWSLRELEKRAEDRGVKLSHSNVGRLINENPLLSITRSAVIGLSESLTISPDRLALEAMRSMGFHPPVRDVSAAEAIQRDPTIDDQTRRTLLAILRESKRSA